MSMTIKRSDLPKDFDWKFYLDNHKDLTIAGLSTEKDAIAHYFMFGKKEGRIYKPVCDSIIDIHSHNLVQQPTTSDITLFVQWYEDKDTQENRIKCLKKNLKNNKINHVHIFYEKNSVESLSKIIKKHKHVSKSLIKKRLSYSNWMLYANKNFPDDIKLLANSDIYFDKTIDLIRKQNFSSNIFYGITRKDLNEEGEIVESSDYFQDDSCPTNPMYSHDAWVYFNSPHLPPETIKEVFNLDLGKGNCDRLFKRFLAEQKISFKNLYPKVNAIHIDHRKEKTRESYNLDYHPRQKVLVNINQYISREDRLDYHDNKLECLCLLITAKELEDGQYKTFIDNLKDSMRFYKNRLAARKIHFRIIRNKIKKEAIDISYLKRIFKTVDIIYLDIPEKYNHYNSNNDLKDQTYGNQSGPSYSFFSIFANRYLERFNTTLFLECDCVLLPNWLYRINNYCKHAGSFLISGSQYDGHNFMKYYNINSQHMNGGICLYATSSNILNKYMDFCFDSMPLYIKYISKDIPYDYIMYYVLENNYDYDLNNREIFKFLKKNIISNTIICNYSNNIPEDINFSIEKIISRYNPCIIHKKLK